jgi:hypothetical protein
LAEIVPAVAENVALLVPDVTVTELGTVKAVALLESDTTVFAITAFDMVTVHVVTEPLARLFGAHETEFTTAGETSEIEVEGVFPPKLAVTVAV